MDERDRGDQKVSQTSDSADTVDREIVSENFDSHRHLIRDEAAKAASTGNAPVDPLIVTSKRVWLTIACFLVIILALLVWGFFGAIPTVVQGGGIMLTGRDLYTVEVFAPARITSLDVAVGDRVEMGQVVARLEEASLDAQYASAVQELQTLQQQNVVLTDGENRQIQVMTDSLESREASLEVAIAKSLELFRQKQEQVDIQGELFREGLIAETVYLETQQEAALLEEKVFTSQSALIAARSSFTDSLLEIETAQDSRQSQIVATEGRVATLRAQMKRELVLRSPVEGQIVEVRSQDQTVVPAGFPLIEVAVQPKHPGQLFMIGYVPVHMGKRIKVGMASQVSPTMARRERYGFIDGSVETVSEYPVSLPVMKVDLQNDILVQQFVKVVGPALRVKIKLKTDRNTISGYKWSSDQGYPAQITPGTEAAVGIVVEETRPIDLVVPWFRQTFGL